MRRVTKNKRGFTLIEMLLVIAIIMILAAVVGIGVNDIYKNAQDANSSIGTGVDDVRTNNDRGISARESKLGALGF